jgi:hypothetical protein
MLLASGVSGREYWVIYRGPGFRLLAHPLPPSLVSRLNRLHTGRLRKRKNLLKVEGKGGGRRAKSDNLEKALPSIKHSILSGCQAGEDYNTRVVGNSPGTFFREIKLG